MGDKKPDKLHLNDYNGDVYDGDNLPDGKFTVYVLEIKYNELQSDLTAAQERIKELEEKCDEWENKVNNIVPEYYERGAKHARLASAIEDAIMEIQKLEIDSLIADVSTAKYYKSKAIGIIREKTGITKE